jgi:hypothetical protein
VTALAGVDRRTLAGRLEYLRDHALQVGESGRADLEFARLLRAHLERALDAAQVQALEVEMLRGEAADRERSRDGLQSARRDLQNLVDVIERLDAGVLSKSWLIERLADSVGRIDVSLNPIAKKVTDA